MDQEQGRVVILADTHFGRSDGGGARSVAALRPLWRGCDRLIFNGDVAEVHDASLRGEAARAVLEIQQACDEDGVDVTFLSGNHDPLLSDQRYLSLCNDEVFVTHGDILHPAISPWTGHAKQVAEMNREALACLEREGTPEQDRPFDAAQHAAFRKWSPAPSGQRPPRPARLGGKAGMAWKVAKVLWYWHCLPREANRFAQRYAPSSRFFVFGHIHRAGVWSFGDRVVMNTGAYDRISRPHAVVIENGCIKHWPIRFDDALGVYALAQSPRAVFALAQGDTVAAA